MKYKLTFIYCVAVLILSVLPGSSFPKVEISNIDKIVHFLLYCVLVFAIFTDYFLSNRKKEVSTKKNACFLLFATFFGAFIEIIQYFLPYRSAEWADLLSNFVGALFGILIIICINDFFVKKQ